MELYGHGIEKIENEEQEYIQQLRTSGLRKPRETFLIEKIMDIRKSRRVIFTSIMSDLEKMSKVSTDVKSKLDENELIARTNAEYKRKIDELNSQLLKKSQEFSSLNDKTEFKLKVYKEKLNMKYESRLKELDDKMKEIEIAKLTVSEKKLNQKVEEIKSTLSEDISAYYMVQRSFE